MHGMTLCAQEAMVWPDQHRELAARVQLPHVLERPRLHLRRAGLPGSLDDVVLADGCERSGMISVLALPKVLMMDVHRMVCVQRNHDTLDFVLMLANQAGDPSGIPCRACDSQ